MALGIVSNDDFLKEIEELEKPKEVNKAEIIDMPRPGRKSGDNNIPESLRQIIGENAIEEGNKATRELTQAFGVSDSSLSAYKNGATSTASYDTPDERLKQAVDKTKATISIKAKNRILKTLNHLTEDKLKDTKAVDLANIAKSLAGVVRVMEPETPQVQQGNGPTFVFYAPPQKREESYDVLVLKE